MERGKEEEREGRGVGMWRGKKGQGKGEEGIGEEREGRGIGMWRGGKMRRGKGEV